jgi:hypothetical protein
LTRNIDITLGVDIDRIEDVIIHKIVAGRPRDIEDVRGILLRTPDVDPFYIKKWLNDFAAGLENNDIVKSWESVLLTISRR